MTTMTPEFTRILDIRQLPVGPHDYSADETERRRLAGRFGLSAIETFTATVTVAAENDVVSATGRIHAAIIQPCAISGEDFPVRIDEPLALRFIPATGNAASPDEEIEITSSDCDEIEYEGLTFDLGEALAQSLALAIDPFAEGPNADKARAEHGLSGESQGGAFAALAALKPSTPERGN
ncbi:YceD family protein [Novosphingobium nitrogenifigens]|nr:DUF177 domain-containing protein [Novosphingobium nitrogenifigens]